MIIPQLVTLFWGGSGNFRKWNIVVGSWLLEYGLKGYLSCLTAMR
jgi:hypothetical protein